MGHKLNSWVDDETMGYIEAVMDRHDISHSRAVELLVREGARARRARLERAALTAKVDTLLDAFGETGAAKEAVGDAVTAAMDPDVRGGLDGDLDDDPAAVFRPGGVVPDEWAADGDGSGGDDESGAPGRSSDG